MAKEKEAPKELSRREFVKGAAVGAAAVAGAGALASCAAPTPEVVKETVEVPVEVTKIVEVPGPPGEAGPVTLELLNPRGEIEPPLTVGLAPRVTDLAGKKIGLYWNGKEGTDVFFDRVQELLEEKSPTVTVLRYSGAFDVGDTLAAKMAEECDTFIYGVGD